MVVVVVIVVVEPLSCSSVARLGQVSTGSVESDSFLYSAVKFSARMRVSPRFWDVRHRIMWHHMPEARKDLRSCKQR